MQDRHVLTDAGWYAYDNGEELVLIFPDPTFKVKALISAKRALGLIREADPQLLVDALIEGVGS